MSGHSIETVSMWLDRLFDHEGGFTDNPKDPGNWTGGVEGAGELKGTKYGIAANTYGHLDIKSLTKEQAAGIYINDFLAPIHADELRDGVAFQLFDFAVNSGPGRAIRSIQKAVGVDDDGRVGSVTMDAIRARSESDLIMLVLAERIDFMRSLKTFPSFGKGWMGRIADNLRYGAEDS